MHFLYQHILRVLRVVAKQAEAGFRAVHHGLKSQRPMSCRLAEEGQEDDVHIQQPGCAISCSIGEIKQQFPLVAMAPVTIRQLPLYCAVKKVSAHVLARLGYAGLAYAGVVLTPQHMTGQALECVQQGMPLCCTSGSCQDRSCCVTAWNVYITEGTNSACT